MIFGVLNPEKIWHDTLTGLSTSPVRCSYITLGNPKKVIFQQYYDDDDDVVTVVVLPESCPARPSGVNLLRFRSKTYSACRTRNPSHLYSTELPSRRALKSTKRSHLAAVAACSRSAITTPTTKCPASLKTGRKVLFCSLAILGPNVGHTMDVLFLFFSRPRSEGMPHHGRTFFIYLCPLSFWLTVPRLDVVHPGRAWPSSLSYTLQCIVPCITVSHFPGNSLVSSWCDHSMLASLLWQCLSVPS